MNEECANECEIAEHALTAALRHVRDSRLNLFLVQVKAAVLDKKRAAIAFEEALYVLRKTQLSGTGRTMDLASITIADFTFIKRISAGAYARVFLAQKQRTGDIYAIKVLPKTEVVQKNQVKRVMLEKDILLQYHNPYIVNFCLFRFLILRLFNHGDGQSVLGDGVSARR
jgi:hypothetical protein